MVTVSNKTSRTFQRVELRNIETIDQAAIFREQNPGQIQEYFPWSVQVPLQHLPSRFHKCFLFPLFMWKHLQKFFCPSFTIVYWASMCVCWGGGVVLALFSTQISRARTDIYTEIRYGDNHEVFFCVCVCILNLFEGKKIAC